MCCCQVEISYQGRSGLFQVWDYCADSDCDGCCTQNMQGTNFLLDIDSSAAKRVFNINNAENTLYGKATFRRVATVNPATVCSQYGCS